jgi:hypothetical protein
MLDGTYGLIENQISHWVRQHVGLHDAENGKCKKLVLRHLTIDRRPQGDVHTFNITEDAGLLGTEAADKIINQVASHAQRDANDLSSGVQTYAIYAYYTKNANYCPRKIFRVAAEDEIERDVGPSEPPTEKGLTQMLMRHLEVGNKNSMVAMGYLFSTFQKELEGQRNQNAKFMSQQTEMAMLVQDVLNEGSKRRIDERKAEIVAQMTEGGFEHLKTILPIIANKLLGKGTIPENGMDSEFYALAALLETMDEKQQRFFAESLRPDQMQLLGVLLEKYEKRKKEIATVDSKKGGGLPADGVPRRLTRLFEKPSSLVKSGNALASDDEFTRRVEGRAKKIRETLGSIDPKKETTS